MVMVACLHNAAIVGSWFHIRLAWFLLVSCKEDLDKTLPIKQVGFFQCLSRTVKLAALSFFDLNLNLHRHLEDVILHGHVFR